VTILSGGPRDQDPATGISSIMAQTVADVRLPASLLDQAVARNRRRTVRNRVISATSTVAVAAAAAALVFSLPGGAAPSGTGTSAAAHQPRAVPKMQTAAYVLAHASAAQVNSRTMISVARAVDGTMYTDVATQQQRYITGIRASNGQPYFEWSDIIKDGIWTETMVVNQGRVYSVETARGSDAGSISTLLPLQAQSNPVAAFNTALKQGTIKVVGHQELDGRDTILLRVNREATRCEKPGYPAIAKANCSNGEPVSAQPPPDDEVWIDASTYLVVQTKNYKPSPTAVDGTWPSFTTTVDWLPPTPANLANLSSTPPPGYTKIPSTGLVKYLGPIS
jgi:hypothetical protein